MPLHEAARARYLNYALSVITSRALPDVRDGLKPVQRRILFTMNQQGIRSQARHRKCAKVVGDVMGNYHPHGDSAIYEALVRMAQPFVMREPLVDGSGNFGSLDGDGAAAMRYTECRSASASDRMLREIGLGTVDWRSNYDGTREEPVVLPSDRPNLLINGSVGIAVGMATSIPPHNPIEVCDALLRILKNQEKDKDTNISTLCRIVCGPDFPTGGRILTGADEMADIYRTGSGSVRVRGTWTEGETTRGSKTIVVDSIPYGQNKSVLVERIADVVNARKLPPLLDVRDVSAEDVRIELILKRDADVQKVLAYLYKHTPLQQNVQVNLTCLVPGGAERAAVPERCDLKQILKYFLGFRMEVVTRRLERELEALQERLHILDGLAYAYDILDKLLDLIRKSEGKADARAKMLKRWPKRFDEVQANAILELKLYQLAKLEILDIQDERDAKRARVAEIQDLLAHESKRRAIVKGEVTDLRASYAADPRFARRTLIETEDEPEFSAEDFIVAEDNVVLVSRDGWIKRQKEVKDIKKVKLREGDAVLAAEPGSTTATIVLFSSLGVAYTARIADIPATTGHGEPVQKRFALKDGERIVAAMSLDTRWVEDYVTEGPDGPPVHALAATSNGYALRFSLAAFAEPSTKSGRRYARPAKGHEVVGVSLVNGLETVLAATVKARAMICPVASVKFLSGPGKGVLLIKLKPDDRLLGFKASEGDRDLLTVETNRGATKTISTGKYEITGRGGRGREIQRNGSLAGVVWSEVEAPPPLE